MADADSGPVRRTWALRLALAYLASLHPRIWSSSEPYRDFWRALSLEGRSARHRRLSEALTIIYAWADTARDAERAGLIHSRARDDAREQDRARNRRSH